MGHTSSSGFLSDLEQLRKQQICVWFYTYGTSRIKTRIRMLPKRLFTCYFGVSKSQNHLNDGLVTLLISDESITSNSSVSALCMLVDMSFTNCWIIPGNAG